MIYLVTILSLVAYLALTWFTGTWLRLSGTELWILRVVLGLVGMAAAAVVVWFLNRRKKQAAQQEEEPAAGAGDEIDQLIREAEAKLAAAKSGQGARIANLPAFLLVGEPGSAKTCTMLASGLTPELLSGQVYQNGNVASTRAGNVWFANRVVFVEAGGRLLGEAPKWMRLVRRLRPRASVVGKGEQAPRAAVVFFDCENFTRPGAGEQAANAARNLRARLGEICETLGINLPVYVLFTKMDRVPFFAEFVRNLSNEEAAQVLGVTLPLVARGSGSIYGEEETARLTGSFERLFRSLCDARPEVLGRETEAARLPGVYEFPREFRKIRNTVVTFLVDLCRPSQLTVGPFLRGFYFSGVRPIVVSDVAPVAAPREPERQAPEAAGHATGMFQAMGARQTQPAPAPQVTGSRKVPQWMFLPRLFANVLLEDHTAMGASGSSTKTSFLRRLLLASAAGLCLIATVCFLISWLNNRSLEANALQAARGISSAESSGLNLPSVDALTRLETLRQSLETIATYRREGAPLGYRMGLYAGNDMYPEVRRIYFDRFWQLLFGQTQAGLLETLRGLPPTPGPEYGPTYDTLKAYLITTSHHDKSTRNFLAPVLLARWSAGRNVDPKRMGLAQKQFEFYADELKEANPYSEKNDGAAIERARRYLAQFAGGERVYAYMLAEASKKNPPINYHKQFPQAAGVVTDNHEVPGAFSKGGWAFMKDAIRNIDRYISGEPWVLGDQVSANIDRARLEQQLRDRYQNDFIAQWRAFLKAGSVNRYTGLKDAAEKLNTLSGNQSPLLALLWLASQNTAVESPAVTEAFQPVQAVVPPASVDRFIAPPNQPYMTGLVGLQTAIDQVANQPGGPNDAAAAQTLQTASAVLVTTRQLAQGFRLDREGRVETIVQALMEAPVKWVEPLLRSVGPAELNGKGKALCGQFRAVLAKYPFNPNATAQATLAEVNGLLRKPDGALWQFYDASLQKLLTRAGSQYVPAPNATVHLNPAFVAFFNHAAGFADALYASGPEPRFVYSLKPLPMEGVQTANLSVDGQTLLFPGGGKQMVWQGAGQHGVRAGVNFGGGELQWFEASGLWAAFQFFGDAETWQPAGTSYNLEWIARTGRKAEPMKLSTGKPLTLRYNVDMGGLPPVFQKAYLARLACVAEVAK